MWYLIYYLGFKNCILLRIGIHRERQGRLKITRYTKLLNNKSNYVVK